MKLADLTNKLRYWDNRFAQFLTRHTYILFFEIILVIIFIFAFVNALKIIDLGFDAAHDDILQQLLVTQSVNSLLIVILFLFNSFWMLYIFNQMGRLRGLLKNIDYNLGKRRNDRKADND